MSYLALLRRSIARDGYKKTFYKIARRLLIRVPTVSYLRRYLGYLLHRTFRGHAIREIQGSRMLLDLKNDAGISKALFIYRKREHLCADFLMRGGIIREGDVVLDIGANIGYYALMEARLVGEKGVVYALEPVSKNFNILKRNVALNGVKNIELYQLAAGDESGDSYINVSRMGNLSSMFDRHPGGGSFEGREPVHLVTVDEFLLGKRPPGFIRFDVEGYEYAIIRGMKKTLDLKPDLFIEIHASLLEKARIEEMITLLGERDHTAVVVYAP
ncbi:MAG: FkbM family methyltransferase, partial [Dehalococcoidales bacterium]|nr:FkbM family methyltransferase [Dehalococcoidales bacterium]